MARLINVGYQFVDANGDPASSGQVYFYDNGTTTQQAVYSDSALTTVIAQPVTLDAAGMLPSDVFAPAGNEYTIAATTATGANCAGFPVNDVSPGKSGSSQILVTAEQTASTATDWTNQFDGDNGYSYRQLDAQYSVGASDPMGAEGTSYVYRPEIIPLFSQLRVGADVGHNSATDANGPGRTGAVLQRNKVSHNGQGDAVCYNASAFVDSQKTGATSFLAQPAVVLYNGDMQAGADYTYLNCTEFRLNGSTYDCSGIGVVFNLERNQDRAAQETYWAGSRIQSQGTSEIDDFAHYSGLAKCGVNLTQIDSPTHEAAIAIKQDDRIYWDASSTGQYGTAFGSTYVTYNGTSYVIHVDGNSTLQVSDTSVITNGVHIEAPVTTLADSATPSVSAGNLFVTGGTTAITDFTGGSTGQTIRIRSAHSVTITDGATIELAGGSNYAMTESDTLELTMFTSGVWTEITRSVN